MKTKLYIYPIFVLTLIMSSCSCSTINLGRKVDAKSKPEHVGVDVLVQPYVDEFMALSKQKNIAFTRQVSVGIKSLDQGNIIGLCTYRRSFREIDLDVNFLMRSSELRKKALVFHELVHCYCNRGHDFGDSDAYPKAYPKASIFGFFRNIETKIPWCLAKDPPGYFEDGCATTIMHPTILPDECLEVHWAHYEKEMFDRCDPF